MIVGVNPEDSAAISLADRLPKTLGNTLRECLQNQKWQDFTEEELVDFCKPTPKDWSLRISFWTEYKRAQDEGEAKLKGVNIHNPPGGTPIVNNTRWNVICKRPSKVLFITRPIEEYKRQQDSQLSLATQRIWEILELPIKQTVIMDGQEVTQIDHKTAQLIKGIWSELVDRSHGKPVSRSENLNANLNVGAPEPKGITININDPAEIEGRLLEIARDKGLKVKDDSK